MENLFIVHVVHSQSHLDKPGDNLVFGEESAQLFLFGDFMEHVSALTIIHYNAKTPRNKKIGYIFSMKDSLYVTT